MTSQWLRTHIRGRSQILSLAFVGLIVAFAYPTGAWPNSLADLTVDPGDFLARLANPWDSRPVLGHDNGFSLPYASLAICASALAMAHVPLWIVGRLGIASVLVVAGLSMRFLTRTLFPDWRIGHWISAYAYSANIFVWVFLKDGAALLLPYAATPLAIALFVRGLQNQRLRHAVLLALVSMAFVGISPPGSAIAAIVVAVCAACAVFTAGAIRWAERARYLAGTVALIAIANVWWIIPLLRNLLYHTDVAAKSVENPTVDDAYSTYPAILRLAGNAGLYSGWQGQPYFPDGPAYAWNPFVVTASFGLPLLALTGLGLALRRHLPYARLMVGLLILSLFLAVGVQPPTGGLYAWLYDHAPGAIAFRASYRWVAVLAFVYAIGLAYVCEGVRKPRWSVAACWAAAAAILVQGWPMLTGSVVPRDRLYNIPSYWQAFADWANAQAGDFRLAYLPGQFFSVYNWGKPLGEPATILVHHPSIVEQPGPAASTADGSDLSAALVSDLTQSGAPEEVATLLRVLDVRYVVQRNDVDPSYYGEPAPGEVAASLARFGFLRHSGSFGQLDIYENTLWTESVVRAANGAQPLARPLVFDEVRRGGGDWTVNTATYMGRSVGDFELRARARITAGQYLGLGLHTLAGYVVAELRTDGSRLEHSVGPSIVPFGTASTTAAQVGEFYDLEFSRKGHRYSFSVDGSTITAADAVSLGVGSVYLVGFNSSISVESLSLSAGTGEAYSLNMSGADTGSEPVGWSASGDMWTVRPLPLVRALVDAYRQFAPIELVQTGESSPSWEANAIDYPGTALHDFDLVVRVSFGVGADMAVGYRTSKELVLGEVRADGCRMETFDSGAVHDVGTNSGFAVDARGTHTVGLRRRGDAVELSVDGATVAQAVGRDSGAATLVLSTFLTSVRVTGITLTPASQGSLILVPVGPRVGDAGNGWVFGQSTWSFSPDLATLDRVDTPLPVTDGPSPLPSGRGVYGSPRILQEEVRPASTTLRLSAEGPSFISLDAAYDEGWVAHIDSGGGAQPLGHFEALGYANGWFVPQHGTFTVTIEYVGNPGWRGLLVGWAVTNAALVILALAGSSRHRIALPRRGARHA